MKANELMIGDYVTYSRNGNPCVIYEIRYDGLVGYANVNSEVEDTGRYTATTSVFEPIPITAEILEKNFDKLGKYKYKIEDGYSWITDFDTFYNLCINLGDNHIDIHISYVHELQHALRLCGIEKEIEL